MAVDLTTNYINKHSFFFFSFVEEKLDESETADKNELGEITKTSQQKTESVVHIKVRKEYCRTGAFGLSNLLERQKVKVCGTVSLTLSVALNRSAISSC